MNTLSIDSRLNIFILDVYIHYDEKQGKQLKSGTFSYYNKVATTYFAIFNKDLQLIVDLVLLL